MCVCEPQAVSTDLMYLGLATSQMSKILMPSHDDFTVAGWATEVHESSEREESVDR